MALERDTLLITNGIVRSYNTTELYCILCESDTSYSTSIKHIASLLHQQNLQWFCPIFMISGNNVKCAICNAVVAWGKVKTHAKTHMKVPWSMSDDNYNKYKIFFENHIFRWMHLFHCCLCSATFPSCDVALIHIANAKHQSLKIKSPAYDFFTKISAPWESFVREGLVPLNDTELQCRFCDCKSVTLSSVDRHIKGLMHVSSKSKFQLQLQDTGISNSVTTVFTENPELEEHEIAQNETIVSGKNDLKVNEESLQVREKFDYIVKKNDSTSYCMLCNCIVLNHAKNDHTAGINHVAALKLYGCEAITHKNSTDYYCGHCDCAISSAENLCQHIIGKKHSKALKTINENSLAETHPENHLSQNSPLNYMVTINETDLRCSLCDCKVSSNALNQEIHLTGKYHIKSFKKYGCYRITYRGGNLYHCGCCDILISHPENVYVHIKEASHLNSLTVADKRNSNVNSLSQVKNSPEISNVQTTKIATQIPLQETACVQHMKSATRETTDVWLKKIVSNVEENSQKYSKLPIEGIPKTVNNALASEHILKLANMMFFCRICDCNIVPPLTVDAHVAEKRHAESLEHFCNEISVINSDKYYCKCCNWTIYGTDNVYTHLHGNRHKKSMNATNRAQRLENEKSSRALAQCYSSHCSDISVSHTEDVGLNIKETSFVNPMTVDEKQHQEATMNITSNTEDTRELMDVRTINISIKEDYKETCPDVQMAKISSIKTTSSKVADVRVMKEGSKLESSEVWGLACPSLSCNYVREKPSGPYCEICDVELSNGIRRHVTGDEHTASLKKYGCDNVSLMGDRYYCASCEYTVEGCENVYRHVKEKIHVQRSEVLAGKRQRDALQKKINELKTTEPGTQFSSILYSIATDMSRMMEQLKRNGLEEMETD